MSRLDSMSAGTQPCFVMLAGLLHHFHQSRWVCTLQEDKPRSLCLFPACHRIAAQPIVQQVATQQGRACLAHHQLPILAVLAGMQAAMEAVRHQAFSAADRGSVIEGQSIASLCLG